MRTFATVLALGAVSVTLHGCGGGGSSPQPSSTCANKKVDLVTQSVQGSTTGNFTVQLDIKGLPASIAMFLEAPILVSVTGDYSLKLDLDNFSMRLDTTDNIELKAVLPIKATVSEKIIFDATTKQLVLDTDINVDALGKPVSVKNCSVLTINEMPPLENITDVFNSIKERLQAATECKGNDGTYDDWRTKALPDPISKYVTASVDLKMDKGYLWHEIDMEQKVDVEGPIPLPPLPPLPAPIGNLTNLTIQSIKASGTTVINVKTASKNGPAASDLDYTKLGDTCTKLPPVAFKDVTELLIAQRMKPQAIAALVAAVAATQESKLVVV